MADRYIDVPIQSEPEEMLSTAIDTIRNVYPDWEPSEPNIEFLVLSGIAEMASEVVGVASAVPTAIFRYFGGLVRVLPAEAAPAWVMSTWTMKDDLGYTIPAGTNVSIAAAGDLKVAFETLMDIVVPPDSTDTGVGEVGLQAVEPGAVGTGLSGPIELVDALDFVQSIAMVGVTAGGADAEEDNAYLNRLSQTLETMSPRPIVPRDFAILARSIPGVHRALALDGYNPADETFDNERMIAVSGIDDQGADLSADIKSAIDVLLQREREVNFIVNVIDPTRTEIDVTYTVMALDGFDTAAVEVAVDAALASYFSPANWGITNIGFGEFPEWDPSTDVVRFTEVAEIINRVDGVNYIESHTIGLHGGSMGTANVNLPGAAPLTTPGTFTGTVHAP